MNAADFWQISVNAGTALPPRLVGQPNEENHLYTVVSPWYDLARTFYQQANLPAV
jgi:hypothetical protein